MKDTSYAEWALGLDKKKMWKLKCFKLLLRRLLDLERVMEQQEGEPEETTVSITRVQMTETLVEEMACEEMKVVEENEEGTKQRVRWAVIEEEHEKREGRSKEDQQTWIKLQEEMTAVQEPTQHHEDDKKIPPSTPSTCTRYTRTSGSMALSQCAETSLELVISFFVEFALISTHCRFTVSIETIEPKSAHHSTRFPMLFRGVMTPITHARGAR